MQINVMQIGWTELIVPKLQKQIIADDTYVYLVPSAK